MINAVFGTLVAWVLIRYRFPARRFFDAIIDLAIRVGRWHGRHCAAPALYAGSGWIGRFTRNRMAVSVWRVRRWA